MGHRQASTSVVDSGTTTNTIPSLDSAEEEETSGNDPSAIIYMYSNNADGGNVHADTPDKADIPEIIISGSTSMNKKNLWMKQVCVHVRIIIIVGKLFER